MNRRLRIHVLTSLFALSACGGSSDTALSAAASPAPAPSPAPSPAQGFVAFAIRANEALGLPATAAQARLAELKHTAARAFAGVTRTTPTLLMYRINPAREINW